MNHDPRRPQDTPDLEASLRRLDVHEVEERLELSPLVTGGGFEPAEGCSCHCDCSSPDPEEIAVDNPPMPGPDGMSLQY